MRNALISTFLHTTELLVCLFGSYFILLQFSLGTDQTRLVTGVAVAALIKFLRATPNFPLKDYVNDVK